MSLNIKHQQLLAKLKANDTATFMQYGFIFLRMPNSASTSMARALRSVYPNMPSEHVRAKLYQEYLGHDAFSMLPVYACLRDPVDCFITKFFRLRGKKDVANRENTLSVDTFQDFVDAHTRGSGPVILYEQMLLDDSGALLATNLFPYEYIDECWRSMCNALGVELELPVLNRHPGDTNQQERMEYYTDELVSFIRSRHRVAMDLHKTCLREYKAKQGIAI
jgi:hypothetical protein